MGVLILRESESTHGDSLMDPEEIVPPMAERIPSPARDGLRELLDNYDIVEEHTGEHVIHIEGKSDRGVIIRLEKQLFDFETGREILTLKIETERVDVTFDVSKIWSSEIAIKFYGYNDREVLEIFP